MSISKKQEDELFSAILLKVLEYMKFQPCMINVGFHWPEGLAYALLKIVKESDS